MSDVFTAFTVIRGYEAIVHIWQAIQGRGYIAGSYAAFMATASDTPILPNDIDVFATSNENADLIFNQLKLLYSSYMDNGMCYSLTPADPKQLGVQIVRPHPEWENYPHDILNSFDLDICRAVLVNVTTVLADDNIGKRSGKILRVNNPVRTLKRIMKYYARGVEFPDTELVKLFEAWDAQPPERKTQVISQVAAAAPTSPTEQQSFWDEWDDEDDYDDDDYYDDYSDDEDGGEWYDDYDSEEEDIADEVDETATTDF